MYIEFCSMLMCSKRYYSYGYCYIEYMCYRFVTSDILHKVRMKHIH